MEQSYSQKGLVKAANKGALIDYVANHYTEMSKWDLKEVLLSVLYAINDEMGEDELDMIQRATTNELADRDFGED